MRFSSEIEFIVTIAKASTTDISTSKMSKLWNFFATMTSDRRIEKINHHFKSDRYYLLIVRPYFNFANIHIIILISCDKCANKYYQEI